MKKTIRSNLIVFCGLLITAAHVGIGGVSAQSNIQRLSAAVAKPSHLRLVDRLDRPQDGYCVDVLGTPGNLRPDLPLFAHNCKPSLTSDSAVQYDHTGQIRFAALDLCVTVAGVNSKALPGTAVLLRKCNETTPFMEAAQLQRFTQRKDGRLELIGTGLCLAVGTQSAATYSRSHRWRPLFVDSCGTVEDARSRWEFVSPVN